MSDLSDEILSQVLLSWFISVQAKVTCNPNFSTFILEMTYFSSSFMRTADMGQWVRGDEVDDDSRWQHHSKMLHIPKAMHCVFQSIKVMNFLLSLFSCLWHLVSRWNVDWRHLRRLVVLLRLTWPAVHNHRNCSLWLGHFVAVLRV